MSAWLKLFLLVCDPWAILQWNGLNYPEILIIEVKVSYCSCFPLKCEWPCALNSSIAIRYNWYNHWMSKFLMMTRFITTFSHVVVSLANHPRWSAVQLVEVPSFDRPRILFDISIEIFPYHLCIFNIISTNTIWYWLWGTIPNINIESCIDHKLHCNEANIFTSATDNSK